ncbi:hypothetical protein GCM10010174_00170 [Kutzneria viridogrisea]|uniref:Uncharacterized protein n=1 Tax=Kutzneria viridogrisea TaxID=47990 RepID=A0ABR6BCD5_9PSEU|nr:hypothetical protein [Kutzneria viridogrisea]
MTSDATTTMRDCVQQRLNYLDTLATTGDTLAKAALADTEILRLTSGWRALLAQHQPDAHGRCPQCSGWLRARRYPCSVWTTAHQHLILTEHPPSSQCARRSPAAGGPTSPPPAPSWPSRARRS